MRAWFYLPLALVLAYLVRRNYRMRSEGLLPDEWYWADVALMELGWAVTGIGPRYKLRRFRCATAK